jgi:ribose 5-phosphate isomerase
MTAQQLRNDLGNDALVSMIMTLVTGLGTGVTVAQVLAPMRRATP